jgi:hypothetical protein
MESNEIKNIASPFSTKRVEFQLKKFHETGTWISDEKEMER